MSDPVCPESCHCADCHRIGVARAMHSYVANARRETRRTGERLGYGLDEDTPPESPEERTTREHKAQSRRDSLARHDGLQKAVILALRAAGHDAWHVDSRAKQVRTRRGTIWARTSTPGQADVTGTQAGTGRRFELEVKTGGGRPTQQQLDWIERTRSRGAIAGVVRSVDEALALVRSAP